MKIVPPPRWLHNEAEATGEQQVCEAGRYASLPPCPDYSLFNFGLSIIMIVLYFGLFWQVQRLKEADDLSGEE